MFQLVAPHGWGHPAGHVDTPASPVLALKGEWACSLGVVAVLKFSSHTRRFVEEKRVGSSRLDTHQHASPRAVTPITLSGPRRMRGASIATGGHTHAQPRVEGAPDLQME